MTSTEENIHLQTCIKLLRNNLSIFPPFQCESKSKTVRKGEREREREEREHKPATGLPIG
jgi:hypothetical protein